MEKNNIRKDKSIHVLPEVVPFVLCGAILSIVLEKNKEADENRLASLNKTKENIDKMVDMDTHLKELCARIAPDLDNCTYQDKKDAYTYLDLKVTAPPDGADIKGYLDPSVIKADTCLPMVVQTCRCLLEHADVCSNLKILV